MMVHFESLKDLDDASLRVLMSDFTDMRDSMAERGRHTVAAFYNDVLMALAAERDRRRREWRQTYDRLRFTPEQLRDFEDNPAQWGEAS